MAAVGCKRRRRALPKCYLSSARPDSMINVKGLTVLITLAVTACGVAVGACGSSSKPNVGGGVSAIGIKYADCMRGKGVPTFPDPSGAGVQLSGTGINTQSPAFRSAQSACQKLLPGGGPAPGGGSPSHITQGVKIAECMRAHGLRSFPDPTISPPSTPPAAGGMALFSPYGSFSLSASLVQSPAFKQAATTCGFRTGYGHGFRMPVALPPS